jgi:hypothetical protein
MNPGASAGTMPEKVLVKLRAMVTAGLAKDVEAVNQWPAVMPAGAGRYQCTGTLGVAHVCPM